MKKLAIVLSTLFLMGCATKLIVIERDDKGAVRTIEAEDYSLKIVSPDKKTTLVAVPSRWLTPNFVAEIFKGVIGWSSILPAVIPTPTPIPVPPIPEPVPVPIPTPVPIPSPTPVPGPAPTASTVFLQTGNTITLDLDTLPKTMRSAGFNGRDNALYYAMSNIYRRGPGPELSVKEGDTELQNLSNQREAIYKWFDAEVAKVKSTMMTYPAMTVVAITNDGPDRLGCRLGPGITRRLAEFGGRVQLGHVLPEPS